jgi:glycosyltransferase involved in cell wall biosynthesis
VKARSLREPETLSLSDGQLTPAHAPRTDAPASEPDAPLYSVIMPTWNRGAAIRRAVISVLRQTYKNFELIVVDDHSHTPASEFLEGLDDNRIRYLRMKVNSGVSAARNAGIRLAEGEYLAFLDDDDEYLPQKLEVLNSAVENSWDVIYHRMRIHFVKEGFSYDNDPHRLRFGYRELLLKNLLGSPSMVVIRRSACLDVGAFDETLPALEDYELWLRLAKAGYKFQFVDAILTNYYRHTNYNSRSLSLENDITAWELLHEKYRDDYNRLSRDEWAEHLQKVDLYRAFRCLLNYRRRTSAKYFLKSFSRHPRPSVASLIPVAALALLSPRVCLEFQGQLKHLPVLRALYSPQKTKMREKDGFGTI